MRLIPVTLDCGKLYVIGGIAKRGWTTHDVELAIEKSLNEILRLYFQENLKLPTYIKTSNIFDPRIRIAKIKLVLEKIEE